MTWRAIQDTVGYSESLALLSHGAERLYWRMLAYSDAWGRLPGAPYKIRALCVPLLEVTDEQIEEWLDELVSAKRVKLYAGPPAVAELIDFDTNQPTELRRRRGPSRFVLPREKRRVLQEAPGVSGTGPEFPGDSGPEESRGEKKRSSPNGEVSRRKSLERIPFFEAVGWKCQRCGSSKHLEVDHIEPVSGGGASEPENYQVLCRQCNRSKGARNEVREIFEHWREARKKSERFTLTPKRRSIIKARLQRFSVDELKQALSAVSRDDWEKRPQFDDIHHLLKNDEAVERWLALAEKKTGRDDTLTDRYLRGELEDDPPPAPETHESVRAQLREAGLLE